MSEQAQQLEADGFYAAAEIVRLRARLAEHEANARAYEEIIGKKTYREVADELASARKALKEIDQIAVSKKFGAARDMQTVARAALKEIS